MLEKQTQPYKSCCPGRMPDGSSWCMPGVLAWIVRNCCRCGPKHRGLHSIPELGGCCLVLLGNGFRKLIVKSLLAVMYRKHRRFFGTRPILPAEDLVRLVACRESLTDLSEPGNVLELREKGGYIGAFIRESRSTNRRHMRSPLSRNFKDCSVGSEDANPLRVGNDLSLPPVLREFLEP